MPRRQPVQAPLIEPENEKPTTQYRATFEQPRGHLNRLNVKVPGQIEIDILATSRTLKLWEVRTVWNNKPLCKSNGDPIVTASPALAQQAVAELYERRVSEWREFKGQL